MNSDWRAEGGAEPWPSSATPASCCKCSFCGKSQKQVKKLIAGPGVYICDECIDLCNEIIEEELTDAGELQLRRPAQPA